MLRYRRYRVFLLFAVIAIFALYRFTTVQEWEKATQSSVEKLKSYAGQSYKGKPEEPPILKVTTAQETPKARPTASPDIAPAAVPTDTPNAIAGEESGLKNEVPSPAIDKIKPAEPDVLPTPSPAAKKAELGGQGRHDAPAPLPSHDTIHWERMPEHFPVPKDSMITLPTGTPKKMPKIQHAFKDETPTEKAERLKKQAQIKSAMVHSWKGYKEHAWLHDELQPVSGGFRDTFCGWGASLVDALDTLWIMGMEKEFVEATKALEEIDFTTTTRIDIPLFETTIRYLGGLLGAYDVSGAKYKILLKKAQEIGDILLAAFDTPNRMPITYYNWRPIFAKNPHRASTRTVLAELGSLTMEFTRLAQLTGEDKYYDAVARIITELEVFQGKSRLPGLWPETIDTSGCQKPSNTAIQQALHQQGIASQARIGTKQDSAKDADSAAKNVDVGAGASPTADPATAEPTAKADSKTSPLARRQLNTDSTEIQEVATGLSAGAPPDAENDESLGAKTAGKPTKLENSDMVSDSINAEGLAASTAGKLAVPKQETDDTKSSSPAMGKTAHVAQPAMPKEKVDCLAQGLESPPHAFSENFKFGGAADSTYEYLPKMHLLLGGLNSQYSRMYEKAVDVANKHLLFRPMIPESDREILIVGGADVRQGWQEYPQGNFTRQSEQSHLLCFTGGMWGMGAKLFNRADDLEIAKKITDGCVWAYENMPAGIMPESFQMIACDTRNDCAWNETVWKEILDPYWQEREQARIEAEAQAKEYEKQAAANAEYLASMGEPGTTEFRVKTSEQDPGLAANKQPLEGPLARRDQIAKVITPLAADEAAPTTAGQVEPTPTYNPYPTHDEYVEQKMAQNRLPKGVPSIQGYQYILRPEAIESVFMMYRITGEEYWREKGWKMWEAVYSETKAEYGHSAIKDVTRKGWEYNQNDEMESFWFAETLKYFYLLFSEPDTISLDEWVLNTEAHPFKRPT